VSTAVAITKPFCPDRSRRTSHPYIADVEAAAAWIFTKTSLLVFASARSSRSSSRRRFGRGAARHQQCASPAQRNRLIMHASSIRIPRA